VHVSRRDRILDGPVSREAPCFRWDVFCVLFEGILYMFLVLDIVLVLFGFFLVQNVMNN